MLFYEGKEIRNESTVNEDMLFTQARIATIDMGSLEVGYSVADESTNA